LGKQNPQHIGEELCDGCNNILTLKVEEKENGLEKPYLKNVATEIHYNKKGRLVPDKPFFPHKEVLG